MATNLFGTDGIRGKVNLGVEDEENAIDRLLNNREISPPIYRLIGESLGHSCEAEDGRKMRAVIGWDDRPSNSILAEHLTIGLNIAGFEVTHIGICATPGLHLATLSLDADFGCMITASHNPVADSGLKIFNRYGFKTLPDFELELSRNAISLSQEDREVDQIELKKLATPSSSVKTTEWSDIHHPKWLTIRYQNLAELIGASLSDVENLHQPILVDSSGGSCKSWLADWLSSNGVPAIEVSEKDSILNKNCGAGDLSPTQEWTFEEAATSSHKLIRNLPECNPGMLVAAALDGDGDRCLLIESTATGYRVIDGDRIADTFVNSVCNSGLEWHLAASIESDLSLTTNLARFTMPVEVSETAVGDRWLAVALSKNELGSYLERSSIPQLIGVEDSGHIVLPSPHPKHDHYWSLVGDGTMTLVAYLLSSTNADTSRQMQRGWKRRQSVEGVDRNRWNGKNQLSNLVEGIFFDSLAKAHTIENWSRSEVPGEPNLMLISCKLSDFQLSLGVRNSGTQAKISVSARLEFGGDESGIQSSIDAVCKLLNEKMATR